MADHNGWHVAHDGQSVGPMSLDELVKRLPQHGGGGALVFGPGLSAWTPAAQVEAIRSRLGGGGGRSTGTPPAPPQSARGASQGRMRSHEIDYHVYGSEMQYVEITLDPGETVIAEAGGMMYMTPGIQMETVFGDPSQEKQGFMGKLMTAGKRVLTGESLFMTTFTASGGARDTVAFASPYPGKIIPMHLDKLGGELICQKDSFLCAAKGVSLGIAFNKRFGAGLFGGEGFIMQRLTGDGWAFVHAGGMLEERTLGPGETLRVDTGCLVGLVPSVTYDIQFVGGLKTALFGGEGLFYAVLRGPGRVWLQSLPFCRLASRIYAAAPQRGMGGREEGSVLGGLGRMLGGDR